MLVIGIWRYIIIFISLVLYTPSIQAGGWGRGGTKVITNQATKIARGTLSKWVKKKSGLYKFTSSTGKVYYGRSVDLQRRLKEHLQSGKLLPKNLQSLRVFYHPKKGLNKVEKNAIKYYDIKSKGDIANVQNAFFSQSKRKIKKKSRESLDSLRKHLSPP